MSAAAIAYRIACAPPDSLGGTIAQHIALLIACRWAKDDGRFATSQVAIAEASGYSEASVGRACRALRSAKVFVILGRAEFLLTADHLPRARPTDRISLPTDGCGQTCDTSQGKKNRPTDDRAPPGRKTPTYPTERKTVPQTAKAVSGTGSVYPLTDVSASSPSSMEFEKEEEDARAGELADAAAEGTAERPDESFGWEPSESEAKALAWINTQGLPWTLPDGTDLRREWLAALRHLKPKEAEQVRQRMAGDTPNAFRKAMGAEIVAVREQRAVAAAEEAHSARTQAAVADESERETTDYLNEARALLAEIDSDDQRRAAAIRRMGFTPAVRDLRAAIETGRVAKLQVQLVRGDWPP